MKITTESFLSGANELAGPYFINFSQEVLPTVMGMIAYAYTLDGLSDTDSAETKLEWLATRARGGDLIFLQIILFMEGLLPEEFKGGPHHD